MEPGSRSPFRQEFLRRAEWRRDEDRRHAEKEAKHRKDKDEREKREERQQAIEDAVAMVFATDAEIAEFEVTLNTYDAATVEALQINEQQLFEVREELASILAGAYVLPDGRRVFESADGLRVFDEHGVEVTEHVDPESIEEFRPKWETYRDERAGEKALLEERVELINYQTKLDEARERAADEEDPLTKAELEELKLSLESEKPDAVRQVLGEPLTDPIASTDDTFDPASLSALIRSPRHPTPSS